jgi:hypothetical protein
MNHKYKLVIHEELTKFFGCEGSGYLIVAVPDTRFYELLDLFTSVTTEKIPRYSLAQLAQRLAQAVSSVARTDPTKEEAA